MSKKLIEQITYSIYKYKEPILYLFFGGLTFLLNVVLFWLMAVRLGWEPLSANIVIWIICVAFAYVTNRRWVFESRSAGLKDIIREAMMFAVGRLATLAAEELILWIGIDLLNINSMVIKLLSQIIVIVGNYAISKWIVFKESSAR